MSLLNTIKVKLGISGTATNNFELDASAANGTMKLARSSGQDILTVDSNGVVAAVQGIRGNVFSGTAKASTSGTSVDFTGIPSWAKRITVMFVGVSTSGTSSIQLQVGAGSITSSGYLGACSQGPTLSASQFTTGVGVIQSTAAVLLHGAVVFTNVTGNVWAASGVLSRSDAAVAINTASSIALSGTIDRLRITTVNGTDTFDAGSINILYEG